MAVDPNNPPPPDCPKASTDRETTYTRTLHRACLLCGGLARTALQLDAPERELARWLLGEEEPPRNVFLAAVEILLLSTTRKVRAS